MSQISDGYNYRDIDKVVETTKKLVFDELSALSNDDDALISAMESGKYKLTKEKFDLAFKSSVLTCSQRITPVVAVRSSRDTCNGNLLSVFVIGQTIAKLVL